MSRDYANRKPRGSNKARTPSRKNAPRRAFPYLPVVMVLALIIGFSYFLWSINGSSADPVTTKPAQQAKNNAQPVIPPEGNKAKPVITKDPNALPPKPQEEWTYLEELKNKEVKVDLPQSGIISSGIYQMQCGSFRKESQANEMKVRIAFQGSVAQVSRSEGSNGIWYRVVLGPFPNKREAEHNRHKMQRAGLNGCLILSLD